MDMRRKELRRKN